MRRGFNRGFTLVEMLVVFGIIGVLAAIMIANISSGRGRARDAVRKSDLSNIKKALRIYYNDFQQYPANNGSGQIMGCGTGTAACTYGGSFLNNRDIYLKKLPSNPSGTEYAYTQTLEGEGFLIEVALENVDDESIAASQARCGVSPGAGIYVECEK